MPVTVPEQTTQRSGYFDLPSSQSAELISSDVNAGTDLITEDDRELASLLDNVEEDLVLSEKV